MAARGRDTPAARTCCAGGRHVGPDPHEPGRRLQTRLCADPGHQGVRGAATGTRDALRCARPARAHGPDRGPAPQGPAPALPHHGGRGGGTARPPRLDQRVSSVGRIAAWARRNLMPDSRSMRLVESACVVITAVAQPSWRRSGRDRQLAHQGRDTRAFGRVELPHGRGPHPAGYQATAAPRRGSGGTSARGRLPRCPAGAAVLVGTGQCGERDSLTSRPSVPRPSAPRPSAPRPSAARASASRRSAAPRSTAQRPTARRSAAWQGARRPGPVGPA